MEDECECLGEILLACMVNSIWTFRTKAWLCSTQAVTVVIALLYIHRLPPSYTYNLAAFFHILPLQHFPSPHSLHLTISAIPFRDPFPRDSALIPAQVISTLPGDPLPRTRGIWQASPNNLFRSPVISFFPLLLNQHRLTAYHNPTSQSRQPVLQLTLRARSHDVLQSRK